jgi:zinc transport system substrate-binding protein
MKLRLKPLPSICALSLAASLLATGAQASQVPHVVVSIKPVHSIVASIMEGVGTPELIVKGAASPHTYNLKPSDAQSLQNADIVFWLGHDMEAFLDKPLETLGSKAEVVSFLTMDGIAVLHPRESGTFEHHDHGEAAGHEEEQGHEHEEGEEVDAHIWLDPENAKAMAKGVTATLSKADPDHATAYKANEDKLLARLDTLEKDIAATVLPVKDKPFIVFHDAYQYFEQRFGVNVAGSITVSPDHLPGAARVAEIQAKVKELGATCVFSEPEFEPKLVKIVMEGTPAKSGVLDPEAGAIPDGPDLYFVMMNAIATSISTCLK